MRGEPVYQVQHEKFILSFYADDLVDAKTVRRAAEERLRSAYGLRQLTPPPSFAEDVERIAKIVAVDQHVI